MPSTEDGAAVRMKRALNCWPWVRSLTHSPEAVIHSPGATMAAWPTTVTRSRCPRALVRSTQKPFSGLWNVTRSTSPASTSRSELSACLPAPGFTTYRGRERSADPSPAGPDRPPRQGPETCPGQHGGMPTRRLCAAPSGPHTDPGRSSAASPFDKVPAWLPTAIALARLAYRSVGMGRGCLFAIRNSRTAIGSSVPLSLAPAPSSQLAVTCGDRHGRGQSRAVDGE